MKNFPFFGNYGLNINQKSGFLLLAFFVFLVEATNFGISNYYNPLQKTSELEVVLLENSSQSLSKNLSINNTKFQNLKDFDPNLLDETGWQKLGFSAKQAVVIIKYKYSLGGSFQNKNQIKSCFVISNWQYKKIEPYIKISSKNINHTKPKDYEIFKNQYNEKTAYKKSIENQEVSFFNPNSLSKEGWEQLGFSSKQAESILKYKQAVGGSFKNKEQIKKCFVINDFMYNKIVPKMLLENEEIQSEKTIEKTAKNLNQIAVADLQEIGIDGVLAKRIISYKNALGWYVNFKQIVEVFGVTERESAIVKANFELDSSKNQKKSIKELNLEALKKHPYTQKYADYIYNALQEGKSLQELEKLSDEDKKKIYWYFR